MGTKKADAARYGICLLLISEMLQRSGDGHPEDLHGVLVAVDEVENLCEGSQDPRAGVEQVEGRDGVEVGKDGVHPDHPEHTGAEDDDDGGHNSLAKRGRRQWCSP